MRTTDTLRYYIKRGILHIPKFNIHVTVPINFNEAKLVTYLQ